MTRREWALDLIRRAPGAPAYGTPEWEALPDGPAKVAAAVRAAECWHHDGQPSVLELRLHEEVDARRLAYKQGHDDGWALRRADHRAAYNPATGRALPHPDQATDVERAWREWVAGVGA